MEHLVKIFLGLYFFAGIFIIACGLYERETTKEYYELYKDCKVLENNHYNGFYSNNTYKLDCDGGIYEVDANTYNEAFKNH